MSHVMTKIDIITRPSKLQELKEALLKIGITGMTVTNVHGCGMTKAYTEVYRGVKRQVNLHEKVKIEIVVCDVPVQSVVDTAKKVLYTGQHGDGKIFIYPVQNVIKIRTGEEGRDALQDT